MRAINDVALDALDKGELIALPVLIVMLLASSAARSRRSCRRSAACS